MKENKGAKFLIIIVVLIILGLQPGVRNRVLHFFTRQDIFSQFGVDQKDQKKISDNVDKNLNETKNNLKAK